MLLLLLLFPPYILPARKTIPRVRTYIIYRRRYI